ncbi:MAG: thiamine-phosphate kinase [Candidatus Hecatellales archaeon]|nr:MAG: thiamine-phosphate kinase [Candidatus Hecatellales archaeon]
MGLRFLGVLRVLQGERELIRLFLAKFKAGRLPLPVGDDVSAWDLGGGRLAVLKLDMFFAGTDLLPGMGLEEAGWKAMVMAVSDFAAKGVKPEAALVGLGLPESLVGEAGRLADGLRAAARAYGVKILGGDTNEAGELSVAVSLFGSCRRGALVSRFGAKPGDLLAVSGFFGLTAAAFKILLEGLEAPEGLRGKILRSVYRPRARLSLGLRLKDMGATASIDSSDGLALSLHQLAEASGVGFRVERLPLAEPARVFAEMHGLDPFDLALYGGEEFELVATFKPEVFRRRGRGFKVIGVATGDGEVKFEDGKVSRVIEPRGWEHFKREKWL